MALSAPPHSGPSVRPTRILLVDDDTTVLRALRRLLLGARPGWVIDVAESGQAALLQLEDRGYDVVVTDLQMPGLGGGELLERLRLDHPSIMRVVHSSHVGSLSEAQLQSLAHGVIQKPATDELVPLLQWAVDHRRRSVRDSVGY